MARIPVLMYHHVSESQNGGLTISVSKLETQFQWLSRKGFQSYHCMELKDLDKLPSRKSVMITFDDAYQNQIEWVYPLLQKYQLKATFFVPMKYLGGADDWNEGKDPIMDVNQLQSLDPSIVELGYHSYAHINYAKVPLEDVINDLEKSLEVAKATHLNIQPIIAYAYGKYPREPHAKQAFFEALSQFGFEYAFRIGNKVNPFPFRHPYEIKRLDIKGEFSMGRFKRKMYYGQLF